MGCQTFLAACRDMKSADFIIRIKKGCLDWQRNPIISYATLICSLAPGYKSDIVFRIDGFFCIFSFADSSWGILRMDSGL